jgi:hypothetical protein
MAQSDEEDDYMNMTFEDAPKGPKYETSLQRAARKRKEVRPLATSKVIFQLTMASRAKPEHDKRRKPSARQRQRQHVKPR